MAVLPACDRFISPDRGGCRHLHRAGIAGLDEETPDLLLYLAWGTSGAIWDRLLGWRRYCWDPAIRTSSAKEVGGGPPRDDRPSDRAIPRHTEPAQRSARFRRGTKLARARCPPIRGAMANLSCISVLCPELKENDHQDCHEHQVVQRPKAFAIGEKLLAFLQSGHNFSSLSKFVSHLLPISTTANLAHEIPSGAPFPHSDHWPLTARSRTKSSLRYRSRPPDWNTRRHNGNSV